MSRRPKAPPQPPSPAAPVSPSPPPPAADPAGRGLSPAQRTEAAARRRALSEWRRQELAGLEPEWHSDVRPVQDILSKVLPRLRLDQRLDETRIVDVWNRTLDPAIAAHAQPTGLHKGTLFIRVDSNVWLSELLRYRRREILETLQLAIGRETIQRLQFRLG